MPLPTLRELSIYLREVTAHGMQSTDLAILIALDSPLLLVTKSWYDLKSFTYEDIAIDDISHRKYDLGSGKSLIVF